MRIFKKILTPCIGLLAMSLANPVHADGCADEISLTLTCSSDFHSGCVFQLPYKSSTNALYTLNKGESLLVLGICYVTDSDSDTYTYAVKATNDSSNKTQQVQCPKLTDDSTQPSILLAKPESGNVVCVSKT
ncbi:MAG: hypothetical protein QNK11_03205 [Legionella sp.]|nr:hypothetical protein [Legionella sp.]